MYDTVLSLESKIIERTMRSGAEFCDLRFESGIGTSLEMKEQDLRKVVPGRSTGVILRALVNGSWGIFSCNDENGLKSAPEMVIRLARASGDGTVVLDPVSPIRKKITWKPEIDPESIHLEDKHELIRDVNTSVLEKEGIIGVTSVYSDSTIMKRIVNSEGSEMEYSLCRGHVQTQITARKDSRILGYRTRVGATGGYEIFRNDDPVEKALAGADNALRILGAKASPSGRMTIIADNDLTGVFAHEAIGHATEADLVISGESVLEGKLELGIAQSGITLIDDATIPGGFGSYPMDDEGTLSRRKTLIEKGTLKDYILNRETASKLGLVSNGGARAQSYSSTPIVRMSNTMIEAGDMTFEELIEDVKSGVYALGTRGGQVDTVRGSFQFSAQQAFLIENGEVTIPLRDVSLSGMTLETMMNIDGIGRDANLGDPGFCGKGQMVPVGDGGPHIRIRNAVVGGGA